jgi:undecaprenyl phosphate N,N'-diacetylbacillosamine 1-phosphate transferase
MYLKILKRIIDIGVAGVLLILFFPLMACIFIALLVINREGPMFLQERAGKNEVYFTLLKDHLRLTRLGRILRKTSLDELPQLINVFKGDMSLIGPRPLLIKYLPFYNAIEKRRHNLRPGISGLAQVSGRNELNWEKRLALDVYYVENVSFKLDSIIFFKTIFKILLVKDVITDKPYTIADLDEERSVI